MKEYNASDEPVSLYQDGDYQLRVRNALSTSDELLKRVRELEGGWNRENTAIIPLGYQRSKHESAFGTSWTQNVRKSGKQVIVTIMQTFPEGPYYQEPKRYDFAINSIDCESTPPQSKESKSRVTSAIHWLI